MVTVTAMGSCPPIQKGKGRVVTMTVTHVNSFVYELELTGFDASGRAVCETLCPTNVHKLFSATRNDWVMTQDLRVGEALRTQSGLSTITGVKRKAGDQRVYNFEVEATHAYYVGQTRTLSHNTDCPGTGGRRGSDSTREHVDQVRDDFLAANPGWKHTAGGTKAGTTKSLPEEYIPGPGGGRKGSSYPDLTFTGPNGEKFRVNTADTNAGGAFTPREERNAERMFNNTNGEPISMIPKPKKCR